MKIRNDIVENITGTYDLSSTNTDTDTLTRNFQNIGSGSRIYILYHYELYKLTIKIYVNKYDWIFSMVERCFTCLVQKDMFLISIIIIETYTISLRF